MSATEILGIDNVMLAVGSLEEARRFYGERLGLPVKFEFPQAGILAFRLGPEEPALILRETAGIAPAPPRATPRVWLEVADARAAAASLAEAGIEPIGPAKEMRTGYYVEIADPWGNVIGFADYLHAPQMARRRGG